MNLQFVEDWMADLEFCLVVAARNLASAKDWKKGWTRTYRLQDLHPALNLGRGECEQG